MLITLGEDDNAYICLPKGVLNQVKQRLQVIANKEQIEHCTRLITLT